VERLEPLPAAADLYWHRQHGQDGPPPLWLPHNQGDVFENVSLKSITGEDTTGHVMLFLHPCTMRGAQGALRGRLTVLAVRQRSGKKALDAPHEWDTGYSVIPLPDFSGRGNDAYTGNMLEMGSVPSSALVREHRVAVFSDIGRAHMLQRIIYHLTRHAPPTELLLAETSRVQAELEAQADWTEYVWEARGQLNEAQVQAVETEFQATLDLQWPDGTDHETVRSRLYAEAESAHVDAVAHLHRCRAESHPGAILDEET